MIVKQVELLNNSGVYKILNLVNGKCYIGSTQMTFKKRYLHHTNRLRNNKHKNQHLQNAFNKYGEDNFEFQIIEICEKEKCLEIEQLYLNNTTDLYNINLLATGINSSQLDIIEKRRQTMLKKYANGELDHVKEILRNKIPWNKGIKYESTDHLKVPKKNKGDRSKDKLTKRSKLPEVEVYSLNGEFLGKWNSARDLQDWSLTELNTLPIKSRFKNGYRNIPLNMLQAVNINKACRLNKPYKGLIFKFSTSPSI